MSNKEGLFYCLLIILYSQVYSQTISTIDTMYYKGNKEPIELSQAFIIESSLQIQGDITEIIPKVVYPIKGQIMLDDSLTAQRLILAYDFLEKGLPLTIGPKWRFLDDIDESKDIVKTSRDINSSYIKNERSNIFSSGSLFRQISLSPLGGSSFNGGLQMQINGKLSETMSISGVLTDQDIPFQPEGTTRELEELDKVYLTISHQNFTLDAGDIFYKNNNINRKMIGINNYFNIKNISGSSVFANSKGYFRMLELKGRDGDQGPYQLIGKDGEREIIILSGTEKVWVNGRELVRGKNHDYTIDYALANIIFTPKILIDFDTDILIEYQYSDQEYTKGFIGGNIKNKWGEKNSLEVGLYNEADQYQEQALKNEILDSLKRISTGSLKLSTAVKNNYGDYVLEESIYTYEPIIHENDTINRYSVVFQYDIRGEYRREISDLGQIYYKYVQEIDRIQDMDLFSPFRTINAPKTHQFGYVNGIYQFNDHISFTGKFSGSALDRNAINYGNSYEDGSYKIAAKIDSMDIGLALMSFSLEDWKRGSQYHSMDRENNILHTRLWNLDSSVQRGIQETLFRSEIIIDQIGTTQLELGNLNVNSNSRSRVSVDQKLYSNTFKHSFFQMLAVNNHNNKFYRYNSKIQLNMKTYSPFISYLAEQDPTSNRFWKGGFGMSIDKNNIAIRSGVDVRRDQLLLSEGSWGNDSEDIIGFVQFDKRTDNGYKQNIIINKRIKSGSEGMSHDYLLLDVDIGKYKSNQPTRWEIQFRQEETLTKQRAIIYDSVGVGLGQYRFDPVFNTYISDPNGTYVAYSILTGNRTPNTNFQGMQKLSFDLGRMGDLPDLIIRANSRQQYRGTNPSLKSIFRSNINDSSASHSNNYFRIEAILSGKTRVTNWLENNHTLDGFDPRGNDLINNREMGLELHRAMFSNLSAKNRFTFKSNSVKSNISSLRNRSMSGWWNDLQILLRYNRSIDLDIGLMIGSESGIQQNNSFSGFAYGIKLINKILYKDIGRFQTEISLINITEKDNSAFIPPEALNGYPLGISLRSNSSMHYFLNRTISMVFSLSTIDDGRYKDFITFQGEVRANF